MLEDDPEYKKLKPTHKQFVMNLLSGKTAQQSYALAYPKASLQVASNKAGILKNKDPIKGILERCSAARGSIVEEAAGKTIDNLMLIAFADVGDIYDAEGKLRTLKELPRPLRMAISEVEIDGDRVKWKMGGKIKSLEMLSKITRLDEPQHTQVNVEIITAEERDLQIKEILVKASKREED